MNDRIEELIKGKSDEEAKAILERIQSAMSREADNIVSEKETQRIEALTAEYRKEMIANRGSGRAHILRQIKEKYRKYGVDVDNVDFS